MSKVDAAASEACRFIRAYYADLGPMAPAKFSREEQHAITILSAYIRARALAIPAETPNG